MRGPVAYMAKNHVAANILMMVLLVGGLLIGKSIKQEVFPEFELDMVNVSVAYPGATPAEIEDAIVSPIELAVSAVDDIKRIRSSSQENVGVVTVEVLEGADTDRVLQDVKSEVDRIVTLPEEAEKPVISKVTNRREVITLVVYGDVPERVLREQAEQIREDLLAKQGVTQVDLVAARPYEISVEISELNLRKYHLTLDRVAGMIRRASLDLAGGSIKADGGEVLIRTSEKRYTGAEFDSVTVFTDPKGRRILLGDIAEVRDGFAELDQDALLDGKPGIMVQVYRVGEQRPKDISQIVRTYLDERSLSMPASIKTAVYQDWSKILDQRINLLLKNGLLGLILVLIVLSLFLELRLALWVAAGIAISFIGALLFLPAFNVSINMISLFAFLIILGIVVDDAIVVGENVYVHFKRGKEPLEAAVHGTREISRAVIFSALTTMAAFGPLLFVGGFVGKFMGVVPIIVITVLGISLVEALLILPSHLSGTMCHACPSLLSRFEKHRKRFDEVVRWFIDHTYVGTLQWAQRNRITTVAISIAVLLITVGLVGGGFVKFVFFPQVDADEVIVSLTMPPGTPFEVTRGHAVRIQEVGKELIAEYDEERDDGSSNLQHLFTLLGQQIRRSRGAHGMGSVFASNLAQIRLLLDDPATRTVRTNEFATKWRERAGEIPGAERVVFQSSMVRGGADVEIELSHRDYGVLLAAVDRLKAAVASYGGTSEVSDSHSEGKRELKLRLRPEASSLGITERDLAVQVRSAFFGSEAMRIQRGRNEVKVMVRYPEDDRRMLATIDRMRIRTPSGKEIPFAQAAYVDESRGFSTISRTDQRRVVSVTAKVNKEMVSADEIIADLETGALADLTADYPGLTYDLEGESREQRETVSSILAAFGFGLLLIFSLLAIPFRSILQPFVVMSAIPFGMVGAILGHLVLGFNLSMISLFGIVALTGVVVNSSLVMIDFINRAREEGMSLSDAIMESGKRRFRPIVMTALTTFFGLTPMILETSLQARFLIPMAVSLGFGVLFATAITLVLVPTLYLILEDIRALFRREPKIEAPSQMEEAA